MKKIIKQFLVACALSFLSVTAFAGTSDSDANMSFEIKTLATGTVPFESDNGPGNDANDTNDYLRTLDIVAMEVQFTTFGELDNTTVTLDIPKELELEDLPAFCNTGSSLTVDAATGVQTMVCLIAGNNPASDPSSSIRQSSIIALPIQLTALTRDRLGGDVANGTEPPRVMANVTATNANTGVASDLNSTADRLIISARPKFDLDIKTFDNPIYRIVTDDDTGEGGVIYQVPILVKVDNGKGTEVLAEDIEFDMSVANANNPADPVPYRLVNWAGAPTSYNPGCFENRYGGKQGRVTLPYGSYDTTYPERSVAGIPTYTCDQANPGDPISIKIEGADSSAAHTPDFNYAGGAIAADEKYIVAGLLSYWIPLSYVDANGGEVTLRNTYTPLTTEGVSGLNNAETNLSNNTTNNYTVITTRGSFTSYYSRNYAGGRGQILAPMTNQNSGNGVVMPTQVYGYRMYGINNGALAWNGGLVDDGAGGYTGEGFSMCSRIDNRTYNFEPLANNGAIAHSIYQTSTPVAVKIEYGSGGSVSSGGINYYDTDGDGNPLTNGQTTFEEMRLDTCGASDTNSGWYSDIRDVPGGIGAVNKIRVVALEPLAPGARFDLGLNLVALGVDPVSNVSLPEGILMPAYTTRTNYNNSSWVNSSYQPAGHTGTKAYGDRLRLTRALVRVEKTTTPNDNTNSVLAGQNVEFQLAPTHTSILKPAPAQAYDVVVTDTLPERLTYVVNSSNRVPDSVTVNPDGTTTIVWTIPNVLLDSAITPITFSANAKFDTPNGVSATNTVLVESLGDGSDESVRTDSRTVVIGNSGAFNVAKTSLTPLVAPGDNIEYELSFANIGSTDLSTGDFIDILPFSGDGVIKINDDPSVLDIPGATQARNPITNFTPTPSGVVNLLAVTPSYANESFLYTNAAPSSIFIDPTHSSNQPGGSTQWCTEAEISSGTSGCPAALSAVTAIRILTPTFPKNTATRNIGIELEHNGEPSQLQTNSFGGRVDGIIGLVYSDATTEMELPAIGVAKNATVSDGPLPLKYTVVYDFNLENLSPLSTLRNISLPENLSSIFGVKTEDWDFVSLSKVSGPNTINVNTAYNGATVTELVQANSSLAKGETAHFQLVMEVYKSPETYVNQVTVTAEDAVGNVYTDLSNNGDLNAIDPDGDGNANEMDTGSEDDENSDENIPTSIILYGSDYGDAPISFGDAMHLFTGSPSVYLGLFSPDLESESQQGSDAGVSATGDDLDTLMNDEDAVSSFPVLLAGRTDYSVTVSCAGGGVVSAWIDFDLSGDFATTEQNSNHPVTCSGGSATLNWTGLSDVGPGDSFIRIRTASDAAELATAIGNATDGEVEDYAIKIDTTTVSGRVFVDSNVNTSNESSEAGISRVAIVLYRQDSDTCMSTYTNGGGYYQFENVFAGTYQVYEAFGESVPVPRNCGVGFDRDPAGYISTTSSIRAPFTLVDTSVAGQDFGDIQQPRLEPNHVGQILPGNVVFYNHKFTTPVNGTVAFTNVGGGNATAGWASLIYRDANCDGTLNGSEAASSIQSVAMPVTAGTEICLINKVYAPANVAANDQYIQTITADFDYNNAIAGSVSLKVRDVTTAGQVLAPTTSSSTAELGPSNLELRKTVRNVSQGGAETDTANQAKPGDTLEYRIYYRNTGTGPLTDLVINDAVPAYTQLQGGLNCGTAPGGMSCTSSAGVGDGLSWVFSGALVGGEGSFVSYRVTVDQ
ncbi:SdrD B-like domain-containing protein [Leucothrix pacifica]|uniref:Uncharacterized protein n=1 Tax=Leucothrix pacifica TaxID=1247513 RepID=A0A317C394_9GAMM|nr:SdrD B-like domain-containing protein [Leucothrix pacifica]PWQ92739.1 hypothetical protein DKW60_19670 [Leucothrix pacifica]